MIDIEELNYQYNERLGIMCGDSKPDYLQKKQAKEEILATCKEAGMPHKLAMKYCIEATKE